MTLSLATKGILCKGGPAQGTASKGVLCLLAAAFDPKSIPKSGHVVVQGNCPQVVVC